VVSAPTIGGLLTGGKGALPVEVAIVELACFSLSEQF
jgi:hypothetical protein